MRSVVALLAAVVIVGCANHGRKAQQSEPYVFIGGEVMHPGIVPWSQGLTLTNAIAQCGGFTDSADQRKMELRRSFCNGTNMPTTYIPVPGPATNGMLLEPNDFALIKRKPS